VFDDLTDTLMREVFADLRDDVRAHSIRKSLTLRHVNGVLSLRNHITVAPTVEAGDIKVKIEEAFRRSAEVDASHVTVDATGSEVTLWGEVRTWAEREQAQQSAGPLRG
jgi:osmotically-inducible protein OsmY